MHSKLKSLFKALLCLCLMGTLGYALGAAFGSQQKGKNRKVSFKHPGESPSILFLRAEFPEHSMNMLDSEWSYFLEKLSDEASQFWRHETYGTFNKFQTPVISPILTLEQESQTYANQHDLLFEEAVTLALKHGIDANEYEHVVISYPQILVSDKPWGALGKVWLPGRAKYSELIHELGHSLGLGHVCTTPGDKPVVDREHLPSSDPFFTMGGRGDSKTLPLPMKYQLQTIDLESVPEIKQKGTYRIYACDAGLKPGAGKAMGYRIAHKNGAFFWLGFYPSISESAIFTMGQEVRDRLKESIFIHLWEEGLAVATVDSTPGSDPNLVNDSLDASIYLGQSFHVPGSEFVVTPKEIGQDPDGSNWVEITIH